VKGDAGLMPSQSGNVKNLATSRQRKQKHH
jgi:hypothetical protein